MFACVCMCVQVLATRVLPGAGGMCQTEETRAGVCVNQTNVSALFSQKPTFKDLFFTGLS